MNRLEIQEIEISKLKPWDDNPRRNNQAVAAVVRSIKTFGFNVPILCDQNLTIIAGHTRWKAALETSLTSVPVIVLNIDEVQRHAFSIADNKTAEIAQWDFPKLRDVLSELQKEDVDLHNLGFSDADLRHILLEEAADENDLPAFPKSAKTKAGDVYALGEHRLICGNASDSRVFVKLLNDNRLDATIGSPPRFNQKEMGRWEDIESYMADITSAIGSICSYLKCGGTLFWNVGSSSSTHHNLPCLHAAAFEKAGLEYLETISWVRPGANFSTKRNAHIMRNRYYYPAHQWEPILIYRKPGPMPRMTLEGSQYMAAHQTDVWEVGAVTNPLKTANHPAVGPVEIPFRALMAYTCNGALVLDPFVGSGTTLSAAEKTGRRAFCIEINPVFCDVTIERWQNFTNRTARLISS